MVRSHSKNKFDHCNLRVARRAQIAKAHRDGWRFVSKKDRSYILFQETWEHMPATLSFRGPNISRFSIFFKVMSFDLWRPFLPLWPIRTRRMSSLQMTSYQNGNQLIYRRKKCVYIFS